MANSVVVIEDRSTQEPDRAVGPFATLDDAVAWRRKWARGQRIEREQIEEGNAGGRIESARWIASVLPLEWVK
jgi:hypothetical protein